MRLKIVLNPKLNLWRIMEGTKVAKTNNNRALDAGGQRREIEAWRLLQKHKEKLKKGKA